MEIFQIFWPFQGVSWYKDDDLAHDKNWSIHRWHRRKLNISWCVAAPNSHTTYYVWPQKMLQHNSKTWNRQSTKQKDITSYFLHTRELKECAI